MLESPGERAAPEARSRTSSVCEAILQRRRLTASHAGITPGFVEFTDDKVERSIPGLFEDTVALHGGRLAIVTDQFRMTHSELNNFANHIAQSLLSLGDDANEPVALLLGNSPAVIAALLGALKAGKMYVPLDVGYPVERLEYMLEDCRARLVVTDAACLPLARGLADKGQKILNIDLLDAARPAANPGVPVASHYKAYLFYTSGSTGKPKGCALSHRTELQTMKNYINLLRICPEDRLTLFESFSFSGSLGKYNSALLTGAAVYYRDVKKEGLSGLGDWLRRHGITVFFSVPTLFRQFARGLSDSDEFPEIRAIRLIGEPVTAVEVELFRKHFRPDCLLLNDYGSTEAGFSAQYIIDRNTPVTTSVLPIGPPVEGMEILILDEEGREVAAGEMGEIAVRSDYLADGYWKRPEETRKRFRSDPDGSDMRIYLTGDCGRVLPDGAVLSAGRTDAMVKVRGFRVELGDVEEALSKVKGIGESAVVARKDAEGEDILVAYYSESGAARLTVSMLRACLAGKLPHYMVPAVFVKVDEMPVNPNGKLDRGALPDPDGRRPALDVEFIAPGTPVEVALARIWSEVLGVSPVGVRDSFFDLGGNSLRAAQVISRLAQAFDIQVTMEVFFAEPTLAAHAVVVTQGLVNAQEIESISSMLADLEGTGEV